MPVDTVDACRARMRARFSSRPELLVEDLVDERRLARAGHAGDAGEHAERDAARRRCLQVVLARAARRVSALARRPARRVAGTAMLPLAGEVLAGDRLSGAFMMSGSVPCAHDLAAVHARAGADVHDIVGGADRVLVVLDDDERVAEVAQAAQRVEQLVVVALVQADATARRGYRARPSGDEPICVARRMRWASPPESVAAARDSVR